LVIHVQIPKRNASVAGFSFFSRQMKEDLDSSWSLQPWALKKKIGAAWRALSNSEREFWVSAQIGAPVIKRNTVDMMENSEDSDDDEIDEALNTRNEKKRTQKRKKPKKKLSSESEEDNNEESRQQNETVTAPVIVSSSLTINPRTRSDSDSEEDDFFVPRVPVSLPSDLSEENKEIVKKRIAELQAKFQTHVQKQRNLRFAHIVEECNHYFDSLNEQIVEPEPEPKTLPPLKNNTSQDKEEEEITETEDESSEEESKVKVEKGKLQTGKPTKKIKENEKKQKKDRKRGK